MWIEKSAILISLALFCSCIFTVDSDNPVRKGKFLGITGYLSGSTDFHVVPFWKQWNALLQVNVEKNKHKHNGIYVLPASPFYYPSYENPYGFYYPPNFGGGLIHANSLHGPMPLLFDDNKQPTTTLAPLSPSLSDKPKFDIDTNDLNGSSAMKIDKHVGFFNLNVRDDRKSHKRDIVHKTKIDDEVVATVVEIIDETTTVTPTSESIADTTTEPSESSTTEMAPEKMETTTPTIPSSTSTELPSSTTDTSAASIVDPSSTVDSGFHPINYYYGGTPNENANYIYFTTPEPLQQFELPTQSPDTISERYDWGDFQPSVQYEYRNYRFIPDNHFVPVVGKKPIS